MFDTEKIDRFCAALLRWYFIASLCLLGILLLLMSFFTLVGISEPGPPPNPRVTIPASLAFLAAGFGCFVGAHLFGRYLRRRRNRHS
jgi:hypothetical protein